MEASGWTSGAARPPLPQSRTVSVAIAAFNEERWIAETLESVLGQTSPAHEVIVIDDGSSDGTAREVARFGERIRFLSHRNRGLPATLNRAFEEATAEYVALCGADDLWDPRKLEWQAQTLTAHPEVDVAFGHARMFGVVEGEFVRPPGTGVLDGSALARRLYEGNVIAAPSAVIRRDLHQQLGGFREDLVAEDYEFWLRALRAGAVFFYDPRLVLHYRRHGQNMSMPGAVRDERLRPLLEMNYLVHSWYADLVPASDVRRILAKDLCDLGRYLAEIGPPAEARRALLASLRRDVTVRALVWLALLRLGPARRRRVVDAVTALQRLVHGARARLRPSVRALGPNE
jgi:glycosyltransferase involved in cell wall biosynthesis